MFVYICHWACFYPRTYDLYACADLAAASRKCLNFPSSFIIVYDLHQQINRATDNGTSSTVLIALCAQRYAQSKQLSSAFAGLSARCSNSHPPPYFIWSIDCAQELHHFQEKNNESPVFVGTGFAGCLFRTSIYLRNRYWTWYILKSILVGSNWAVPPLPNHAGPFLAVSTVKITRTSIFIDRALILDEGSVDVCFFRATYYCYHDCFRTYFHLNHHPPHRLHPFLSASTVTSLHQETFCFTSSRAIQCTYSEGDKNESELLSTITIGLCTMASARAALWW